MKKNVFSKSLVAMTVVASFFSNPTAEASRDNDTAEMYFETARSSFYNALIQQLILQDSPNDATARSEANQYFTQALQQIANALSLDSTSGDYSLLASQIYRARGVGRYAERSFTEAESIYRAQATKSPKDIGAKLDLAIALYAGDARNWKNSEEYQKEARKIADEVIALCRKKRRDGDHLRAYAMACIVKDKIAEARKTLEKAVEVDPSLASFKQDFDSAIQSDSTGRRFLLYYMTIRDRNENL